MKDDFKISDDLKKLLEHQKQLKTWLKQINKRIFELEEQYLDETQNGNIIRGWDTENTR